MNTGVPPMRLKNLFRKPFSYRRGRVVLWWGVDQATVVHAVTIRGKTIVLVQNLDDGKLETVNDLQTRVCLLWHLAKATNVLTKRICWHAPAACC